MELLTKIGDSFHPLTIFAKSLISEPHLSLMFDWVPKTALKQNGFRDLQAILWNCALSLLTF